VAVVGSVAVAVVGSVAVAVVGSVAVAVAGSVAVVVVGSAAVVVVGAAVVVVGSVAVVVVGAAVVVVGSVAVVVVGSAVVVVVSATVVVVSATVVVVSATVPVAVEGSVGSWACAGVAREAQTTIARSARSACHARAGHQDLRGEPGGEPGRYAEAGSCGGALAPIPWGEVACTLLGGYPVVAYKRISCMRPALQKPQIAAFLVASRTDFAAKCGSGASPNGVKNEPIPGLRARGPGGVREAARRTEATPPIEPVERPFARARGEKPAA
jgi:hypothetical protein